MVPGAAWVVTGNCSVSGPKKPQPVLLTERARVPYGLFTPGSSHLSWCLKALPPKATYIPGVLQACERTVCLGMCFNLLKWSSVAASLGAVRGGRFLC